MSQSLPGVSPFPFPFSDVKKRKNKYHCSQPLGTFPPSVKSPSSLSGVPCTLSRRLHRSKTLVRSRKSKHAFLEAIRRTNKANILQACRAASCDSRRYGVPLLAKSSTFYFIFSLKLGLGWPVSMCPCEYYIEVALSVFLVAVSSELGW